MKRLKSGIISILNAFLCIFIFTFNASYANSDKTSILFIGDSMIEAILKPSQHMCNSMNYRCSFVFKRGLRTDKWLSDYWAIDLLVNMVILKPNVIVISSGTNDIYAKENKYQVVDDFIRLSYMIKSISKDLNLNPYIIIVAPPIPRDRGVNRELELSFGSKCIHVLKSKDLHLKLRDGIHPDSESSKEWARVLFNIIRKHDNGC